MKGLKKQRRIQVIIVAFVALALASGSAGGADTTEASLEAYVQESLSPESLTITDKGCRQRRQRPVQIRRAGLLDHFFEMVNV